MKWLKDITENEFGEMEGIVYFHYLKKDISIVYDKALNESYIHKIVNYLNKVDEDIIHKLCIFMWRYCQDTIKSYPDNTYSQLLRSIQHPLAVMNYFSVKRLKIDLYDDEASNVLNISGSCEWAPEDGFQWLIKDDEILYVGNWDDLDIWLSPLDDRWSNYVLQDAIR